MLHLHPRKKEIGQYSVISEKLLLGLLFASALLFCRPSFGGTQAWKVFSNRAGWTIQYPRDWKISSCKSCPDPAAPNVFVDFFPPVNSDAGWVMVEHLEDKPKGMAVDAWFTEVKKTANLNPQLTEQRLTLNGLPALRVRYRNPDGDEMEEVYVVSGFRTFEISFGSDKPALPLERSENYRTFLQMVETFTVKR